ncbi:MAG: hypothetical protein KKE02_07135 [Alphaproteobacteria bacterium]|nr:hypothetical protein [Alphaproteobacteria bacterium]MBU1515537.1 hypothetical protein [Alphaproteobacteria bacterium]MBU2095535.1 hypothetical protein [Alphaproteobacteria bacterium]MBU2150776.1 hypothetical protein [Alphaproteobacteria bacterium]MBU2307041.1 hypothetical protein [Alphaproteobacteria bacterium]
MRRVLMGLLLAGIAGAAHAADFVVVTSNDPAIPRGQEYAGGQAIQVAPGKSIVVIDPAGNVKRLAGGAAAQTVPRRQLASVDDQRMAVVKLLLAPPRVRRAAPKLDQVCPAADLKTFDGILAVAPVDGCLGRARDAFEAYVERAAGPEPAA